MMQATNTMVDPLSPQVAAGWRMEEVFHPEVDRRERYFFFAGDEPTFPSPGGMTIQTPCIPFRQLRRCQVTPLLSKQMRLRKEEIPEGRLIPGTLENNFGWMWLFAGPEGEQLLYDYGNGQDAKRNWGLVELDMLRGWPITKVAALKLTEYFFPNYPDIPATNGEVLLHLEATRQKIETDAFIEPDRVQLYQGICDKMIDAVERAQRFQERVVDTSNTAVERPAGDMSRKDEFDARDYIFAKRSQTPMTSRRPAYQGPSVDPMFYAQLLDKISNQQPQASADIIAAAVAAAIQTQPQMTPELIAAAVKAGIQSVTGQASKRTRSKNSAKKVIKSEVVTNDV